MKQLILIRHSNAESTSFGKEDHKRELTNEGIKKAIDRAMSLLNKNIYPDLILSSNAVRAIQTAEIFAKHLNQKCRTVNIPFLYFEYTTNDFFNLISEIDACYNTVFIIAHNPTLSVMASRLDDDALLHFNTCDIAIFEISKSWKSIEIGDCKLIDYIDK
jgi:phosphohistidine phosphatase